MARTALILLHGSGSTGAELRGYLEALRMPSANMRTFRQLLDDLSVDLITPTAPLRPYTPCDDEMLNVWFNRSSRFMQEGVSSREDLSGADASLAAIRQIIADKDQDYEYFVLGGFSMGGCLALHAYRTLLSPKLCAVFTMGSFLVDKSVVFKADPVIHCPLLMMHGDEDDLINMSWGSRTATNMLAHGLEVEFRSYAGISHEIAEEQLVDAASWLRSLLDRAPSKQARPGSASAKAHKGNKDADDDDIDVEALRDDISELAAAMKQVEKADATLMANRHGTESKVTAPDCFPYYIEYDDRGAEASGRPSPRVIIHFQVPEGCVESLTVRPVMACGSAFEVTPDSMNKAGVQVVALTYDPEKTAQEVGRRLMLRLARGSNSINPCQMN